MKRAALLALFLCACATAPPDAARVEVRAENGEARVVRVDGGPVIGGSTVRIAPGRHRLVLYCRYNLSIMVGDAQSVEREIEADLAPGGRYRIEARMAPEPCTIRLVAESP